jgi:hypothetical protein
MGLSSVLSRLIGRRPRRLTPDQLKLLRDDLTRAYQVSYYLLGDKEEAKRVTLRAFKGLIEDGDSLKHRVINQGSYRHKRRYQSRIRRVPLPFELELAARIFSLTTPFEKEKAARGQATREDFDVWFCECVLLQSLRGSNAFSALVGLSNFVHSYKRDELTSLFDALAQASPRSRESWETGDEPIRDYLKKFDRAIADRFGDQIKTDERGNLVRRDKSEQPADMVAECILTLTFQEAGDSCLGKTTDPARSRVSDIESELRRLHIALHRPCYAGLAGDAGLSAPEEKAAMPEYTIMLSTNNHPPRKATALGKEELDKMVDEFQLALEDRRKASPKVIITVDGVEEETASAQLFESGRAHLRLKETAKLVEVWAREETRADVLLTAFFLSLAGGRRTVTLEAGQKVSFDVDYAEGVEGDGSFEINVGYRETGFARKRALSRLRRAGRPRPALIPRYAPAALLATLGVALVVAGVGGERFANFGSYLYTSIGSKVFGEKRTAAQPPQPTESNKTSAPAAAGTGTAEQGKAASTVKPLIGNTSVTETPTGLALRKPGRPRHPAPGRQAKGRRDRPVTTDVPLIADIKNIYVESIGVYDSAGLNAQVHSSQVEALKQSGLFQPRENPGEADARLVVVSDFESATGDKAQAQLVTVKGGKVIWYGPLLSVVRDGDRGQTAEQIKLFVGQSTKSLMTNKEQALKGPRPPARQKRARKQNGPSPKE